MSALGPPRNARSSAGRACRRACMAVMRLRPGEDRDAFGPQGRHRAGSSPPGTTVTPKGEGTRRDVRGSPPSDLFARSRSRSPTRPSVSTPAHDAEAHRHPRRPRGRSSPSWRVPSSDAAGDEPSDEPAAGAPDRVLEPLPPRKLTCSFGPGPSARSRSNASTRRGKPHLQLLRLVEERLRIRASPHPPQHASHQEAARHLEGVELGIELGGRELHLRHRLRR